MTSGSRNVSALMVTAFLLCAVSLEATKGIARLRMSLLADFESSVTFDDIDEFGDGPLDIAVGHRHLGPADTDPQAAIADYTRCVERSLKFDKPSRAPPV